MEWQEFGRNSGTMVIDTGIWKWGLFLLYFPTRVGQKVSLHGTRVFRKYKDRRIRRKAIILCLKNLRGPQFKHYSQHDAIVTRWHAFISTDSTEARPNA
jgi:hypothetical protein